MILSLFAAAAFAQAGPPKPPPSAPLRAPSSAAAPTAAQCLALAKSDPAAAAIRAGEWRLAGGGVDARHCQALAYAALGRWPAAGETFAAAAAEAQQSSDPRRADFLVQAGNAWLAAGDPARARPLIEAALAVPTLTGPLRGEALLDRARAAVALGQAGPARADIDEALKLVPQDPFAWYLSSALALRESRLARAQDDIAEALRLAPEDPDLLVHAGNVAGISGEIEAARGLYVKAIKSGPNTPAAAAARQAIAADQ